MLWKTLLLKSNIRTVSIMQHKFPSKAISTNLQTEVLFLLHDVGTLHYLTLYLFTNIAVVGI